MDAVWGFLVGVAASVASFVGITEHHDYPKKETQNTQITEIRSSPTPAVQQKFYVSDGKYTFLGQNISYTLKIPQETGNIEGSFTGSCTGTINGVLNSDKTISGSAEGKCPFGVPVKGTYTGKLDEKSKWVNIKYGGSLGPAKHSGDASLNLN